MKLFMIIWVLLLTVCLTVSISEIIHMRLEMKKVKEEIESLRELIILQSMVSDQKTRKYM